jgi:tetratricopeptide (TPR) repeat protein
MALGVVVLHSMVDDVYYGYGGAGIVALFVPMAFASRVRGAARPRARRPVRTAWVAGSVASLAALTIIVPSIRARIHANLGAVMQTRLELKTFEWPKWPLQDAVRRSFQKELEPAVAQYTSALALDPSNVTANRRLGQIQLSLGRYRDARLHLAAAFVAAPAQPAARQMYGESLAATGEIEPAAQLWRSKPFDEDQLQLRQAWYDMTDQETASRIAAARALLGPAGRE